MNYCGITRKHLRTKVCASNNVFNAQNNVYESLGEKIIKAVEYGSEIGAPATVQYDESTTDDIDVMTSPDHDFFDIAEQFGERVNTPAPPPAQTDEVTE